MNKKQNLKVHSRRKRVIMLTLIVCAFLRDVPVNMTGRKQPAQRPRYAQNAEKQKEKHWGITGVNGR